MTEDLITTATNCDICNEALTEESQKTGVCQACGHKVIADITLKSDTIKIDAAIANLVAVVKSDVFNGGDSSLPEYALKPSECVVSEATPEVSDALYETISVQVTPDESQIEALSCATVEIDGKTYDLGILSEPIVFFMTKSHVLKIFWTSEDIETFEFISKL